MTHNSSEAPAGVTIVDEAAWQSARDGSNGLVRIACIFAEHWARLMESEIGSGKKLEDIADSTYRVADTECITGTVYGIAVDVLTRAWKYGEQLRKWHNKQWGGNDGNEGVVSPTVIILG